MNISLGQITLVDLIEQIERREVVINKDYQRGSSVWPDSARTYFIDTILEGYPFPKIYLYQIFSEKTQRPIKEVVDGQQRLSTIIEFRDNKIKLTSASKQYSGLYFRDLEDDVRKKFISYQVEVSTILSASRPELLEMFRRINAYTAPLTAAEKRHAMYQGKFKWFIVELADEFSPLLENFKIFTPKQLARMHDAEFISDMVLTLEKGIVEKSARLIEGLYKNYELDFKERDYYYGVISDFFHFLSSSLQPLHNTFMMKSYVVNSLFSAYVHCKYGIPSGEEITGVASDEKTKFNLEKIIPRLEELASAHENQEEDGAYKDYVKACLSSTTKTPQRTIRFRELCHALKG